MLRFLVISKKMQQVTIGFLNLLHVFVTTWFLNQKQVPFMATKHSSISCSLLWGTLSQDEFGCFCWFLERPGCTSQRASSEQSGAERDDGILLPETGRTESKLCHSIITVLSHICRTAKLVKIRCKCHAVPKCAVVYCYMYASFVPRVLHYHSQAAC